MDNKEMLYEISLKYNTLKMYEATLEQMRKNGKEDCDSFKKVSDEKDTVEKELIELLNPILEVPDGNPRMNPSIDENKLSGNAFISAVKQRKKGEYKEIYDIRKNFFDEIKKDTLSSNYVCVPTYEEVKERIENEIKDKKPSYWEVQEKISNSQWISCSNFIINFPKNEIDIDEWRVSGFYYNMNQRVGCSSSRCTVCGGDLYVSVNDFSEVKEDGTYNILSKIVNNLYKKSNAHVVGNIYANIISNDGETLYAMCFENCRFKDSDCDGFSYETTGLRKVNLHFNYDELHILAPKEKMNETAN